MRVSLLQGRLTWMIFLVFLFRFALLAAMFVLALLIEYLAH